MNRKAMLAALMAVSLITLLFIVKVNKKSSDGDTDTAPAVVQTEHALSEYWSTALPSLLRGYSKVDIERDIEKYNAAQAAKCPPENEDDRCVGYTELSLTDGKPYFSVGKMLVEKEHTARHGIDAGEDSFLSAFFSVGPPVHEVIELDAPTIFANAGNVAVSVPARQSCAGMTPEGSITLVDLRTKQAFFSHRFDDAQLQSINVADASTTDLSVHVEVSSELQDPNEESCDVGVTVLHKKEMFFLTCAADHAACVLDKQSSTQERGCQIIGCD
jgi:hypothetical protein